MEPTSRDYYQSDAYTAQATVLELITNEQGGSVVLDRTIFVPQGGGQPADRGTIANFGVVHVEVPNDSPGLIVHHLECVEGLAVGGLVVLRIDPARRQLHSKLHTAGHLVAALVERILPGAKACGGHHWPGEGRVEFEIGESLPDGFGQGLQTALDAAVRADFPVRRMLCHDSERYVQIADFPALRCGGTHCWHLGSLGGVAVRSFKRQRERLRVGYEVISGGPPNYEP